jgi:hypothetical protein
MIYRDKGLEVSIPSVSDLRVKDLRISEDDLGLKAAYAVSGEVGGERKAALILVIDDLPSPIQTRLDRLNVYEVRLPASELSLPIDERCVLSPTMEPDAVLPLLKDTYLSNTLLHEFLHLWVRFESDYIEDIMGQEAQDLFNAIEDFLIQVTLVKAFKHGLPLKPYWTQSNHLIRINPTLLAKIHLIKAMQKLGCGLKTIGVNESEQRLTVTFYFTNPKTIFDYTVINELIFTQLAAYEEVTRNITQCSRRSRFVLEANLPFSLSNLLQIFLSGLGEDDATLIKQVYLAFKEVGEGILSTLKTRSLKKMHDTLINYLSSRIYEGLPISPPPQAPTHLPINVT